MYDDIASPVALDIAKDPQGFVIIEHVRDEARLFFRCVTEDFRTEQQFVGCLHFKNVWHLESSRFGATKHYPNTENTQLVSYYLQVKDSSLLDALSEERTEHEPSWRKYDNNEYHHWIVESHDFYTDIIAGRVDFSKISGDEARRCHLIWEKV